MLSSTSIPAMSRDGWSPQPRMRSWRKTSSTTPSTVTVAPRTPSMLIVAARCGPKRYRNPPPTVHADRGGAMVSKPVSELLVDLGVLRSHSRPRTSNDNPYSEAQFKTLKSSPDFPDKFGSLEAARPFCDGFFVAYNHEHRHSGIGMHTPASVHFGTAEQIRTQRQATLNQA